MGKHLIVSIDDVGVLGFPSYADEISEWMVSSGSRSYPSVNGVRHKPSMPNLAALEAKGVRFTRAYANTICGPTRMLMYTGKYGFKTGVANNINQTDNYPPATTEVMLPELMTGHNTAMFGKWHLASAGNGLFDSPITVGKFDTFTGIINNISADNNDSYWYWFETSGSAAPLSTVRIGSPDKTNRTPADYLTKHTADDALAWLTANGGSGDWIVWVNFQTPHAPLHKPNTASERTGAGLDAHMSATMETVTQAYEDIANGIDVAANTATLEGLGWIVGGDDDEGAVAFNLAMIETWDYELGRLLAHAEVDLDLNSDVTIWAFSDNGPFSGVVQTPFDSDHAKQTQYELGINVPFVVAGNGVPTAQRGKTCRRLVSVVDMVPTIAAMESVDISAQPIDGVDISSYFTDPETTTRVRDFVYSEKFLPRAAITDSATGATDDPDNPLVTEWERSIQDEGWKLITKMPTGPASTAGDITYELYNIKGGDRQEVENLILGNRLTLAGVNHSLEAWEALQRLLALEAALLP